MGLSALLATPALAQSLAEVAKKQEEQRKEGKSAPKVYTNGDLKAVPPPASGAAPSSDADTPAADAASASSPADKDAAAAETPAAKPAAGDTRDRAYWNKRIAAAREQLERDRVMLDAMQSRINVLTMDFINRDDPAQRGKIANDRDRAMLELERLQKTVAAGEKAIPAIEEEARRAGVPPGWLR